MTTAQQVFHFWFRELDPSAHFKKDPELDQKIRARFRSAYDQIVAGQTADWRSSAEGRLAEIIVLDQFARNMFRGTPQAFQADPLALKLAEEAVAIGDDRKLPIEQRSFFYMPYMHSEDPEAHQKAMELFSQPGLENGLNYEILHKRIIDRFGRYPHRNEILGRVSTPEEIEFLKEENSSF